MYFEQDFEGSVCINHEKLTVIILSVIAHLDCSRAHRFPGVVADPFSLKMQRLASTISRIKAFFVNESPGGGEQLDGEKIRP